MGGEMTTAEINILNQKALTRKDGVYSFRGNYWVVKNHKFIAYAKPNGQCLQRMGAFDCGIGNVESYKRKEMLLTWLKSQK